MTTSDAGAGAVTAALSSPEVAARRQFLDRLTELGAHPQAATILSWYGLEHLLDGLSGEPRIFDLAAAVHHLENALDPERAPLPQVALMEADDIARHPGFDNVEQEVRDEEDFLLTLRRTLCHG